jgi:thioredoxin
VAPDREADLQAWLDAQPLALVDFWATWCAPCKVVSPLVARIAQAYAGALAVAKVDVDGFPRAAARYGVQSVPTLVVLRHGQPLGRLVGVPSPDEVVAWLRQHAGEPPRRP